MKKQLLFLSIIFTTLIINAQNTIGTVDVTNDAYEGYTLFTTHKNTYLINNCGQVINKWESDFLPGNSVYLLPNGNLLRAGRSNGQSDIVFGGTGGNIELFNWEGEKIWSYSVNNNEQRQHHDVFPMPNGNILILIAEDWSGEDAIKAGRDPLKISDNELLYNEKILEVKPIGNNQVEEIWEWNIKDHLVQDFDATKDNFGTVSEFPGRLDVNFINGNGVNSNWLHVNSIQYSEKLDQIVLSSRNLSEIWVIDHSTTTEEAKTSSGGNSNLGGDFLYRWGNPQSYQRGTENDRKLYGQHFPHFIEEGFQDAGKILLFNNGNGRTPGFSEVMVINPPLINNLYQLPSNNAYSPSNPDYVYSKFIADNESEFYSAILSGAQRLKNGNTLICEGTKGRFFEIDTNDNIVWEYIAPIRNNDGQIYNQGDLAVNNTIFRATKYGVDYEAFIGRNLTVGDPIENDFNLNPCNKLSVDQFSFNEFTLYPNPTKGILNLAKEVDKIEIFSVLGTQLAEFKNTKQIDVFDFKTGVYLVKAYKDDTVFTSKFIKN